jgi:hypothetical protein
VADDILLESEGPRTVVRLLCSGIPDLPEWAPHYVRIRSASERALARLRTLLEARE